MSITDILNKGIQSCIDHKNEILTGLSVVGVAVTGYLSARAGKKEAEMDENIAVSEKVKNYIPAIASGAITSACIIANHQSFTNKISELVGTSLFLVKSLKATENKDGYTSIKEEIENSSETDDYVEPRNYIDDVTGREFQGTEVDLLCAEININHYLHENGEISVGTYLDFLGIDYDKHEWTKGYPDDLIGWTCQTFWQDGITPWIEVRSRPLPNDEQNRYVIRPFFDPFPLKYQDPY